MARALTVAALWAEADWEMIIATGEVELEARLWEPEGAMPAAAALLCHPHPLYGGTMNNRVIYRAGKGAVAAGLAALRFNFRGVGASAGDYSGGTGERKDVAALLGWLRQRYPRLPLALIGFSFGAWVGLQVAAQDPRVAAVVGLGVPIESYDFEFLVDIDKPALYIVGTHDEFCPRAQMESLARRLPRNSTLCWVDGADHFFSRQVEEVQSRVRDFLRARFEGQQP